MTEDEDRPAAEAGDVTQVAVAVDQDQALGGRKRREVDVPGMPPFFLAGPVHRTTASRSCRLFERVVTAQVFGTTVNDRASSTGG